MAGAGCPDAALDAYAQQCEVAQQVEQLVARQLVVAAQFEVVQVACVDLDVGLVEDLLEVLQLLVRNGVLDHDDGVVQIAALDEVHLHQRFQFVQEDERAARGDFVGEVVAGVEGGVLVADHLRVVVHVQRDGEFVVGVEDDRHALFGDRVDHLFGHVVELALGLLVGDADFGDGLGIGAGRTVHDRGFARVDVDYGVVHAQRPERRHDMFDRAYAVTAGFDGRTARSVYDVVAQGGNYGLSLDVRAAEYDSGVRIGGVHGHGHFDTRMEALAGERDRGLQRLLFCRHKQCF